MSFFCLGEDARSDGVLELVAVSQIGRIPEAFSLRFDRNWAMIFKT